MNGSQASTIFKNYPEDKKFPVIIYPKKPLLLAERFI
jgi:hypothetical protein